MRAAQQVMADLAASGLTPEQLALVMELSATVAAEARPVADEAAERRRAKDREYQAEKRRQNRQTSADVADEPSLDKEAPQTPKEINPITHTGSAPARGTRAWPCPEGVDPAHWGDLLANRKTKRLGFTPTAYRGQLRQLADLADDEWPPGRLVQHAAEKGWGAIHDPRQAKMGYDRTPQHHPGIGKTAAALQLGGWDRDGDRPF